MSEPVLYDTFVDSSWAFHIINFFCCCPCIQSFFSSCVTYPYMNMGNIHRMFVTHIHRASESRNTKNTYDFLVQVWNFLLPLSLKVLQHKEERCTIFIWWLFHLPPTTCGARSAQIRLASASPESLVLNYWLFQNPQNPPCTLPVHDIIQIPKSQFSIWDYRHLWMTHPPYARVNTCAQVCTWLTHVLSQKVLSLTKPKGKIYKTKSLGHYITHVGDNDSICNFFHYSLSKA